MSNNTSSTSLVQQQDYEAIQAAVMETERGRWFLTEYAKRNRVADTDMLLSAIQKLETSVAEKSAPAQEHPDVERIRFDIADMASAIAETKQQIASITAESDGDSNLDTATAELDAIVQAAEHATSDILQATENIQEVSWTMREEGTSEANFDKLDEFATDIYTACSFQDITGQRISKVINVLEFLEARVMAMMNIWDITEAPVVSVPENQDLRADAHLLNGPQLDGKGVDQHDIDLMMSNEEQLFDAVVQTQKQMNEGFATDPEDEFVATTPEVEEIAIPAELELDDVIFVDTNVADMTAEEPGAEEFVLDDTGVEDTDESLSAATKTQLDDLIVTDLATNEELLVAEPAIEEAVPQEETPALDDNSEELLVAQPEIEEAVPQDEAPALDDNSAELEAMSDADKMAMFT